MRWLHGEGVAVLGYASRHGGDDAKGNSACHRGRSGPPVVGRVDRRWYWCALVGGIAGRSVGGALVGGAIGAVAGALIADAARPRTCVYRTESGRLRSYRCWSRGRSRHCRKVWSEFRSAASPRSTARARCA